MIENESLKLSAIVKLISENWRKLMAKMNKKVGGQSQPSGNF